MSSPSSSSSSSGPGSADNSQSATDFLRNASFNRSQAAAGTTVGANDMSAADLLSGSGAFDVSKLHPMAQLGDSVDYLVLEDDKKNALPGSETALPSRGWSDDLCYGTGTTYLSGTL